MLNGIKDMIKSKNDFMESTDLIMEEATGMNLDDLIVLGEESEVGALEENDEVEDLDNPTDSTEGGDDEGDPIEGSDLPEDGGTETEDTGAEEDDVNDDILDAPIEDDGTSSTGEEDMSEPAPGPVEDDILDQDISSDEPMGLPGGEDELPTPVGAQTGEEITGDIEDILDTTIDLKSNTPKDTLPIPPAGASDAIQGEDDDILSHSVDSGFGGESGGSSDLFESLEESVKKTIKKAAKSIKNIKGKAEDVKKLKSLCDDYSKGVEGCEEEKRLIEASLKALADLYIKAANNYDKFDSAETTYFPGVSEYEMLCKRIKKSIGKIKSKKKNVTKDDEKILNEIDKITSTSMNESVTVVTDELGSLNSIMEAITLDGGGDDGGDGEDTGSADSSGEAPDESANDPGPENDVTSAVRDKVSEAETGDDVEGGGLEDIGMDGMSDDGMTGDGRLDMFKSLSKLSKDIEGIKEKLVANSIQ